MGSSQPALMCYTPKMSPFCSFMSLCLPESKIVSKFFFANMTTHALSFLRVHESVWMKLIYLLRRSLIPGPKADSYDWSISLQFYPLASLVCAESVVHWLSAAVCSAGNESLSVFEHQHSLYASVGPYSRNNCLDFNDLRHVQCSTKVSSSGYTCCIC